MEIRDSNGLTLYQSTVSSNKTTISDMEFYGANLYQSRLHGIYLYNCLFRGGDIDEAHLEDAQLEHVVFEGCMMCDVNFRNTTFINVEFYDVILFRTDFSFSKWTTSRFYGVDLKETQFFRSTLVEVSFLEDHIAHKTDICSANFAMASFKEVLFNNVIHNDHTVLPNGWSLSK